MQEFITTLDSCRDDIKASKLSPLHKQVLLDQLSLTERRYKSCVELGIVRDDDLVGIVEIQKTLRRITNLQQAGKGDTEKWW